MKSKLGGQWSKIPVKAGIIVQRTRKTLFESLITFQGGKYKEWWGVEND